MSRLWSHIEFKARIEEHRIHLLMRQTAVSCMD
jgi:hypothetical protein